MNPNLRGALARYTSRHDHAKLNALRHDLVPFRERVEVAQELGDGGFHRGSALWYASALRHAGESRAAAIAYRLGNALRMAGHDIAAERVLDAVRQAQPQWIEPVQSLAWLYRNNGRYAEAADVLGNWLGTFAPSAKEIRMVTEFALQMDQADRAEAILAGLPSPDPGLQAERGRLQLALGRFDDAEASLREALERDPSQGDAWVRLAQVRRWKDAGTSPVTDMEAALGDTRLNDSVRARVLFALAKVNDDLGRHEQAWTQSVEANALRRRSVEFDRGAWARYENNIYQTFTEDFSHNFVGTESQAPVFIVGMPRSGTTLLERRLGRHPRLQPEGELEVIDFLAVDLVGRENYPSALAALSSTAYQQAVRMWPSLIPAGIKPGRDVIDKNSINYIHLGLISKLFSNARIVLCRRDPLDTALSLWMQNFAHPRNDYAYEMESLAWMFGFCRRLMAWWEKVLPGKILTVDYEALVARPEHVLEGLVKDLGLDWEPSVLEAPGTDEGAIFTSSAWEARQPIYADVAGRWRNYESWLAPLREALEREGIET